MECDDRARRNLVPFVFVEMPLSTAIQRNEWVVVLGKRG